MHRLLSLTLSMILLHGNAAMAQPVAPFAITVEGIAHDNAPIPETFALCKPTPDGKSDSGANIRPHMRWSGAPVGTQSFALLMTDPDVPADFTDASKPGKTIAADAPRQLFYHWALANIPAHTREIAGGAANVAPAVGTAVSASLGKYVDHPTYYGGPCPPWNDARVHRYMFRVIALDVAQLPLSPQPTAEELAAAVTPHTLGEASITGTYTLNASLLSN